VTKTREFERSLLSECQLKNIPNELRTLQKRFPSAVLTRFTPAMLVSYCERGVSSLKTCNNHRAILATFFKFTGRSDGVWPCFVGFFMIRPLIPPPFLDGPPPSH